MLDRHTAEPIAEAFINRPEWNQTDRRFIVFDDATSEKPYGWIFFYQSERYIQTGELRYTLSGNVPSVSERADASIHPLAYQPLFDLALAEYESRRPRQEASQSVLPPIAIMVVHSS